MFMIPPNNLENKNSSSTQCPVNDSMSFHVGIPIIQDPTMIVTITDSKPPTLPEHPQPLHFCKGQPWTKNESEHKAFATTINDHILGAQLNVASTITFPNG